MKRATILLFFLLSVCFLSAQETISVSLRADNNQPFTAKISGKQINSSLSGYLQIPDLQDGVQEITVSFPENRFPEQQLRFSVSKTDTMFYLKRSGEQTWVIQNANIFQQSNAGASASTGVYGKRKTDPFAVLMAAVVNDSSVLYTSMAKAEPVKKSDPVQAVVKTSSPEKPSASAKPADSSVVKLEEKKPALQNRDAPPVVDANTTIVSNEDKSLAKPSKSDEEGKAIAQKTDGDIKKSDSILANTESPKPESKRQIDSNIPKSDSAVAAPPNKSEPVEALSSSEKKLVKEEKKVDDSGMKSAESNIEQKKQDSSVAISSEKPEQRKVNSEQPTAPTKSHNNSTEKPVSKEVSNAETLKPPVLDNNTRIYQLGVVKAAERKDEAAMHLIYIDRASPDKADTIVITIPNQPAEEYKATEPLFRPLEDPKKDSKKPETPAKKETDKKPTAPKKQAKPEQQKTNAVIQSANEKRQIDSTGQSSQSGTTTQSTSEPLFRPIQKPAESTAMKVDTTKKEYTAGSAWRPLEKKATAMVNSDCQNFATEYDLDRLRVKMLADNNADDRVSTARKVFKTKCFSAKQIRALIELFNNDEGKYKFLDAAYPFVSDTDNFKQLAELLKDQYYVNRFNAMLRN